MEGLEGEGFDELIVALAPDMFVVSDLEFPCALFDATEGREDVVLDTEGLVSIEVSTKWPDLAADVFETFTVLGPDAGAVLVLFRENSRFLFFLKGTTLFCDLKQESIQYTHER